jgi:hypothetical protein
MSTFRKTLLGVAIILLIIALVMIGVSMANSKYNQKFPPIVADCPDYWTRKDNLCINKKRLGTQVCHKDMDFTNSAQWTGSDGVCNKKKWAQGCNLTWDGITNNIHACN